MIPEEKRKDYHAASSTLAQSVVVNLQDACHDILRPEFSYEALSGVGADYTTPQHNTHKTEIYEVHYPWHPYYGLKVFVHRKMRKYGRSVFHCSLKKAKKCSRLEIPEWMLDRAQCSVMKLAEEPYVNCLALTELRKLLNETACTSSKYEVKHQQRSLRIQGGADAKWKTISSSRAEYSIPSSKNPSIMEGASRRHPANSNSADSEDAARSSQTSEFPSKEGRQER